MTKTFHLRRLASLTVIGAAIALSIPAVLYACGGPVDLVLKKTGPATLGANDTTITYTFTVSQVGGPGRPTGIVVHDTVPAGLKFKSASNNACTLFGNEVRCTLVTGGIFFPPVLPVTFTVTFDVLTEQPLCGPIVNTAFLTVNEPELTPATNTSTVTTDVPVCIPPDIRVEKSGPSILKRGDQILYSLLVQNISDGKATNVKVTDSLPPGLQFLTASVPGGTCTGGANNQTISCTIDVLAPHASVSVLITAQTNELTPCGTLINTVAVSTPGEVNTSNNSASTQALVECVQPKTDLTIVKSGPATVNRNDTITYALLVTNLGPDAATDVTATDTLPGGVQFLSAIVNSTGAACSLTNANSVHCPIGALAAGASTTIAITVKAQEQTCGLLTNVANVNGSLDQNGTNNSSTVQTNVICEQPKTDIAITKSGPSTITRGQGITYTLQVQNIGTIAASDVRVTDTVPTGITNISASTLGGTCTVTNQVVLCTYPIIAAGAAATITITGQTTEQQTACGSTMTNTASVTTVTPETNPNNNSSTVQTNVICEVVQVPDLIIDKTGTRKVDRGEEIEYEIRVTNLGPGTATNITVTDSLPDDVEFDSASVSGGSCTGNDSTVTCTIASLASGASADIDIRIETNDDTECGEIENRARVSSSPADLNLNNNEDTFDTEILCAIIPPPPPPPPVCPPFSLTKQADRGETQPGSSIYYTITLRNDSPAPTGNILVEDRANGGSIIIEDAGGGIPSGNGIAWPNVNLAPGSVHVLQYRIRAGYDMQHGDRIDNTVTARSQCDFRTASASVRIIKSLPQTGVTGSFFGNSTNHLRPHSSSTTAPNEGNGIFVVIATLGVSIGGLIGKKFLIGF